MSAAETSGACADNYSTGTLDQWLAHRERVAGGLWLHRDPEVAAVMLAEALGGREAARRWALALLKEVGR